jgi:hypothetical protein
LIREIKKVTPSICNTEYNKSSNLSVYLNTNIDPSVGDKVLTGSIPDEAQHFSEKSGPVAVLTPSTVDGWMNSPGHRKNILTPAWLREGIGVSIAPTG